MQLIKHDVDAEICAAVASRKNLINKLDEITIMRVMSMVSALLKAKMGQVFFQKIGLLNLLLDEIFLWPNRYVGQWVSPNAWAQGRLYNA